MLESPAILHQDRKSAFLSNYMLPKLTEMQGPGTTRSCLTGRQLVSSARARISASSCPFLQVSKEDKVKTMRKLAQ